MPKIFIPGVLGFSKIWEFYPGDWGCRKSGNSYPEDYGFLSRRSGIFENLGIFVPGGLGVLSRRLGFFENLRIFIPRIGDFYLGDRGFSKIWGFLKTGVGDFRKFGDFYHRDLYPGDKGFFP